MKETFFKILAFILRPFAKGIRYGALKLMKAMGNSRDRRPFIAAAGHIIEDYVLPSVFRTFRENEFRRLAHFEKLPVSEHDRIFNELQVAGVSIAEYALGEAKQYVKDGDFHFWSGVEEEFPRQYQKILIGFGIDGSNAKLMRELVKMRQHEYDNLADRIWDADALLAPEVKKEINKKFNNSAPEIKRLLSAVHAVALGTVDHIRRGKIEEKDKLVNYLMIWLLQLRNKTVKFVKRL
jgi:hypothetical protein